MIRRLNKHSDLKDLIKSCPSGVIDDIYAIEYYIQGYNTVIQENFTKKETMLEVIIPSTDLETLPNGILMRRAYYKVLDASYPDGYYNLEFEDNMNVWIGENESEEPVIPEYVTEEELEETLEEYVTEEELADTLEGYVTSDTFDGAVGDLNAHINAVEGSLSGYTTDQEFGGFVDYTESRFQAIGAHLQNTDARVAALEQSPGGVSQEQFAAHVAANNESFNILQGVTQDHSQRISALENAGFATSQDLDDAQSVLGNDIQAVQDSVDGLDQRVTDLENATFQDQIDGLDQRVTDLEQGGTGGGTWGSITGDINDQSDLMYEFDKDRGRLNDLEDGTVVPTGTATESWVENQNYVKYNTDNSLYDGYNKVITTFEPGNGNTPLLILVNNEDSSDAQYDGIRIDSSGIYKYSANNYEDPGSWTEYSDELATQDWVQEQGYLTSSDLSGYATETWVQNQGYLTQHQDLTGYATQTWATNQFLEESKVWTGTETQWNALTPAQKASYTIALIVE